MKKRIFKLMSFAVVMAAMASCTDDLGIGNKTYSSNADLVATLTSDEDVTRLGMLEVEGHNAWDEKSASGWKWVFTENDKVRVFTMQSMLYQSYQLIAGENTAEGEFEIEANQPDLPEGMQKYAITDAQFAYGVSPMPDGTPRLTYSIPYKYKAETFGTGTAGTDVQKLPAPFWGTAVTEDKVGASGKILRTNLWALTSFLRINMESLPDDAKYIVLTTHGSVMKTDNGNVEDGFQLLTPNPNNTTQVKKADGTFVDFVKGGTNDNLTFWNDNARAITDGNSEPLSGTFNALLENKQSKLVADDGTDGFDAEADEIFGGISRLTTRDEIVIDVTSKPNNGVFWIPIITQHYNNLHVLAVTEMSKYTYKYVGTELKKYHDWEPVIAKRYHLDMNIVNAGKVCAHDLNEIIDQVNIANKYNLKAENIINVDELIDCPHHYTVGNTLYDGHIDLDDYPNDQILVQGEGDLVLNIAKISATSKAKGNLYSPVLNNVDVLQSTLFVSDFNYGNGLTWKQNDYSTAAAVATNSVKINVPVSFAEVEHAVLADLPKTNAIFAANNNYAPAAQQACKDLRIDIHGSATEFVNGREVKEAGSDGVTLKNSTEAAITVESGFGQVNVLAKTKGDVYVNGAANAQKLELSECDGAAATAQAAATRDKGGLFIYTDEGLNVLLAHALVANVGFLENSNRHKNFLITVGSSAMEAVGIADALGTGQLVDGEANDLSLLAYWTGQALDLEAVDIKKYDVETVYTAAQLSSMGEKSGGAITNEYKVCDLLEYIWLGGDPAPEKGGYGWVGPTVTVDNFHFDGNNVALVNMFMPKNVKDGVDGDVTRPIYTYDPHICCTTCGWLRPVDGATSAPGQPAIEMKEFGLIRSIKNGDGNNIIENVKLNDVHAKGTIGKVGSLVGTYEATAANNLTLENNFVGEVRIDVTGDKVGGLMGNVEGVSQMTIDYNTVGNSQYTTGEIKGGKYVGGAVGYLKQDEAGNGSLTITDTTVDLAENIESSSSDAAGLVAYAKIDDIDLENDQVKAKNIKAVGDNAAGFIGEMIAEEALVREAAVEVAESIEAGNQYAAGLVSFDDATTSLTVRSSDIKVNTIKAVNGYAAGEVAYADQGDVIFGYDAYERAYQRAKHLFNNVDVETLAASYNAGGFVGSNNNNAKVWLLGNTTDSGASTSENSVEITTFENTKGKGDALAPYYNTPGSEHDSHLAGTMSNIVGNLDGWLYINESKLTVVDNLNGPMKKDVGYQYHNDQLPTPGLDVRKFWGDSNGYVGFGKSGRYFIDKDNDDMGANKNAVVGDQALNTNGFNLYKLDADYNTKSKNAPAE